jgi:hypothetical protein
MSLLRSGRFSFDNIFGRYQAGLQLDKTPENDDGAILKIRTPNYPDFVFEWHPRSQKVYVIRLLRDKNGVPEPRQSGELVAFNVANHGAAQNTVLVWLRGYQTAANDRERVPFLKAEDY